jgi:molybdopterin converting factor subunit 1
MRVQVRLFAGARELVGSGSMVQTMDVGATVQDLVDMLFAAYPELCEQRLRFAVNSAYAPPETILHDGDEVAFIPPVGGG